MSKKEFAVSATEPALSSKIASIVLGFIADVPESNEHQSRSPELHAKRKASAAARQAALAASALALPPGPAGWLTILPEMVTVWKIQARMVADIAALYGKTATLTREQMLYCLFRHTAAQALRDLVVRGAERFIVRRSSLRAFQSVTQKIGVNVTQRAIGKGVSRWFPVVGAVGVGAYAYYDTAQVAATAMELFACEIEVLPSEVDAA